MDVNIHIYINKKYIYCLCSEKTSTQNLGFLGHYEGVIFMKNVIKQNRFIL